ncbi:MAG: hypothetical protein JO147_11895, partial [Actinobacteria bacterium]|nr:hypothetical protein [Actinomycetota bacterium]
MSAANVLVGGARPLWAEQFARLRAAANAPGFSADQLEELAIAAHCLGRMADCTDAWSRAHAAHLESGDWERAASAAAWCSFVLLTGGDFALGNGWITRVQALCDEHELDGSARGFILGQQAAGLMFARQYAAAAELFEQSQRQADRLRDVNGGVLSRLGRGQCLIQLGRGPEGLNLLDEVMLAVSTEELSPLVSGLAFCAAIESCQQVLEVRRAQEWTSALTRWCEQQPDLVPYRGNCLV